MAETPYLVALALVELNGKRSLPIAGRSQGEAAAHHADPGQEGLALALELLLRLWQRSDEGPLQRAAGDTSLLLVEIPLAEMSETLPSLKARWLSDGDTVTLGAHTLQVRHCPGHTPGHVVFYSPEIKRAFVGDVLFAGSIGRTDFPQGNHDDLIASITQRLWPMGHDTVFIPGHGPESTFGRERQSNPYVRDK